MTEHTNARKITARIKEIDAAMRTPGKTAEEYGALSRERFELRQLRTRIMSAKAREKRK